MSLQSLLALFENLPQVQISGPEWLAGQRYDLKAVASDEYRLQLRRRPDDANAPREVLLLALQEIRRRFQLQSHREKREITIHVLRPVDGVASAINRPGSGFHARVEGAHRLQLDASHGEFRAENVTIGMFIIWLQNTLKRPVIDESGATAGWHSFRLIPRGTGDAALLAAIREQLGLQLIEEKRDLEILIVDHASRVPSEH